MLVYIYLCLLLFGLVHSGVWGNNTNFLYEFTTLTKKDVENFVVEYENCSPHSSYAQPITLYDKGGEPFQACDYQYFCHKNENCIKIIGNQSLLNSSRSLDDEMTVHGTKISNINSNDAGDLIMISCSEKGIKKEQCTTDVCQAHEECYSGNCVDGICRVSNEKPAYVCRTVRESGSSEAKVECLWAFQEGCRHDNDCADNTKCNSDKICHNHTENGMSSFMKYVWKFVIILVIVLIVIAILGWIIKKKFLNKRNEFTSTKY